MRGYKLSTINGVRTFFPQYFFEHFSKLFKARVSILGGKT